ncbi:MAG: hypothetical protein ACRDBG_16060 [Waterburya sp.]
MTCIKTGYTCYDNQDKNSVDKPITEPVQETSKPLKSQISSLDPDKQQRLREIYGDWQQGKGNTKKIKGEKAILDKLEKELTNIRDIPNHPFDQLESLYSQYKDLYKAKANKDTNPAEYTYISSTDKQKERSNSAYDQLKSGGTLKAKGRDFVAEFPDDPEQPVRITSGTLEYNLKNDEYTVKNFLERLTK